MRRYQYNPRVLDVARRIPRGTIVDREGLVLATDDRELLRKPAAALRAARAVAGLGLSGSHRPLLSARRARVSPARRRRHAHELERVEHVVRRARQRSQAARLRRSSDTGRDRGEGRHAGHGAAARLPRSRAGPPASARPGAPGRQGAVMGQRRELRLTIDARLQVRVAAILAEYARRSSSGRAAAVVLDPATGDLLASVSYPWPSRRRSPHGGERQGDGRRCAAGSRALRPVSARLDVQAHDGRRRPPARLGRRRADLHLRPPARRSRRRAACPATRGRFATT